MMEGGRVGAEVTIHVRLVYYDVCVYHVIKLILVLASANIDLL